MKTNLKALCAAGLVAMTMTFGIIGHADEKMKMGGKMDKMSGKMAPKMDKMDHKMSGGKMMSCPACKMMDNKMSDMDKKEMGHMMSMMSASEKKTYNAMSPAEKALVTKAAKAGLMHGKMMGKMGDKMGKM